MRKLILLRGPQGSYKSTWVKDNGLSEYTIEQDAIRLLYAAPGFDAYGNPSVSNSNEFSTVGLCMELLEHRMKNGCFTIFDACNIVDLGKFRKLAEKYRYKVYYLNFESYLEELRSRNSRRGVKAVPDEVLFKTWQKFVENPEVGPWCTKIISYDGVTERPQDFSGYENIYYIGDLQGCYTVLKTAYRTIGDPSENPNNLYIFVGDLVDRGIENDKVIAEFLRLVNLPNVLFLEGNHERWLFDYVNGVTAKSREFSTVTQPQLDAANVNKEHLWNSLQKLNELVYHTYGDLSVLVTHAGMHAIENDLTKISSKGFIHGYGGYECDIDSLFNKNCSFREYQVHGHRNEKQMPIRSGNSFNLEGRVEFQGGCLRIAILNKQGWDTLEVPNIVYKNGSLPREFNEPRNEVMSLVRSMRSSSMVKELAFDHISSFSFTKDAWKRKQWNDMTVKARGFFVDCKAGGIVTRSYDKFFNVGEISATTGDKLLANMEYPVRWYKKENGFLGLIGWDISNQKLFISSKSATNYIYDGMFQDLLDKLHIDLEKVAELASAGYCFAFEVVHNNDPHIIDYNGSESIYLLDVFKRSMEEERVPYDTLVDIALDIGAEVKVLCGLSGNPESLEASIQQKMASEEKFEGYVLEGSNGFKAKIKLPYYSNWKSARSKYEVLNAGVSIARITSKSSSMELKFLQFCSKRYEVGKYPSLIEARREFERCHG